jgi:hypothetical protein
MYCILLNHRPRRCLYLDRVHPQLVPTMHGSWVGSNDGGKCHTLPGLALVGLPRRYVVEGEVPIRISQPNLVGMCAETKHQKGNWNVDDLSSHVKEEEVGLVIGLGAGGYGTDGHGGIALRVPGMHVPTADVVGHLFWRRFNEFRIVGVQQAQQVVPHPKLFEHWVDRCLFWANERRVVLIPIAEPHQISLHNLNAMIDIHDPFRVASIESFECVLKVRCVLHVLHQQLECFRHHRRRRRGRGYLLDVQTQGSAAAPPMFESQGGRIDIQECLDNRGINLMHHRVRKRCVPLVSVVTECRAGGDAASASCNNALLLLSSSTSAAFLLLPV